jgi:protein CLEC16A
MFANNNKSSAGEGAPTPPPSADSRFSLVELRKIHQQLVENKIVDDENKSLVVEILRVIAEMVVYGDNKSELLFDFFCEKNMLHLFLEIMWSEKGCPTSVHIQILQTLSILISCVKNDTSLYYLLSNNYINEIITFPHDFTADESLLAQFASFMKSLSLRLNIQTVQFFFIEDTGAFPLLTKAVELLSCKDPMIRISAQTTILNVYQVDEPRSRAYALQDDVMNILFEGIILIMKDQYNAIQKYADEFINSVHEKQSDLTRLKQNFEDVGINLEDWLFYLQDLMGLKIEVLQKSMSSYLLNNFICPVLLDSLVTAHNAFGNGEPALYISVALNRETFNFHQIYVKQ